MQPRLVVADHDVAAQLALELEGCLVREAAGGPALGGERGDGDVVLAPAAVDRARRADAWTFDESARVPAVDIDSAGSAVADFNAVEDASSPVPLALDEGAPEATPPASPGILVIRADDPSPESE